MILHRVHGESEVCWKRGRRYTSIRINPFFSLGLQSSLILFSLFCYFLLPCSLHWLSLSFLLLLFQRVSSTTNWKWPQALGEKRQELCVEGAGGRERWSDQWQTWRGANEKKAADRPRDSFIQWKLGLKSRRQHKCQRQTIEAILLFCRLLPHKAVALGWNMLHCYKVSLKKFLLCAVNNSGLSAFLPHLNEIRIWKILLIIIRTIAGLQML